MVIKSNHLTSHTGECENVRRVHPASACGDCYRRTRVASTGWMRIVVKKAVFAVAGENSQRRCRLCNDSAMTLHQAAPLPARRRRGGGGGVGVQWAAETNQRRAQRAQRRRCHRPVRVRNRRGGGRHCRVTGIDGRESLTARKLG